MRTASMVKELNNDVELIATLFPGPDADLWVEALISRPPAKGSACQEHDDGQHFALVS